MSATLRLYKTEYFQNLLRFAADYYDETAGYDMAEKFLSIVEDALGRIADNPYCSPRYVPPEGWEELAKLHYRVLNLSNASPFPYSIYYEIERERIIVHSVYHHARNRERLLSSEM